MTSITILCLSVKETKDYDAKKEDFGFKSASSAASTWVVKFEVVIAGRKIKPALAYETEAEARRFGDGRTYTALEWLQLAFG